MRHKLKRKNKLTGHFIGYNTFVRNSFEGKIMGKRTRERPRYVDHDVVR